MKILVHILFVLLIVTSCNKKPIQTSEVNLINTSEGTITLRALGYGKSEKDAFAHAEKQAFDVILFRGIPRSTVENPIIENEGEVKAKHSDYLKKFYQDELYKSFVMSSVVSSSFGRDRLHGGRITIDIKINLFSLRKELEKNNLIRKFGF